MTSSPSGDELLRAPQTAGREAGEPTRGRGHSWAEAGFAVVAFAALCLAVLSVRPQIAEPDDGAYHHSIVAVTMGHYLSLSTAELDALDARLGSPGGRIPNQWVQLANGRYISEKDPGYPYLAAPFETLGLIRWAPLFYGLLACIGLFIGARRWLGAYGGAAAVGLFCSAGAVIAFAWRDYMPTFTDASLVAAGSGVLLWAVLATESSTRRRTVVGLAGFVALEIATFVRYTNVVILGCAVLAVVAAWRSTVTRLSLPSPCWWLASVAVFGTGIAVFNARIYGGLLTTGYRPGEVTFGLGAIRPNLQTMPAHLLAALPTFVLGLLALAWIALTWLSHRRHHLPGARSAGRDLSVGLALGLSWFSIWGVYSAYTWTTDPTSVTVQVVRFYLPATGAISLLAAWLVTRLPSRSHWVPALAVTGVIAVLFAFGVWQFHDMYAAFGVNLSD
jgi:hypothetical protein